MHLLDGIGVCPGTVVGPAVRMPDPLPEPPRVTCSDPAFEAGRIGAAMASVAETLERMADAAEGELADVLSATSLMANDPSVLHEAVSLVETARIAAPRAVWEAFGNYRELVAAAGGYLAERVADLDDVRNRIVAELLGVSPPGIPNPGHPYILVAHDIAPADTVGIDPGVVLGFVTEDGGPTSHTAILAKSLGTPAVVACPGAGEIEPGQTLVVDGGTGLVVVAPDDQELTRAAERAALRRARHALAPEAGHTADGERVLLLANIGDPSDTAAAVAAGAQGVGLFRTEFLFLDHERCPTIEQQTRAYAEVFAAFPQRKVIVRTLDAGADKPLAFLGATPEPNPALGVRGIRFMRAHRHILVDQLSAIAAAAKMSDCDVHVMAPMIATPDETAEFVALATAAGIECSGVMVEVPAAVLLADEIFRDVQFASIGTNDLTQYTYAADRLVAPLATLNDHWQPAVTRLVDMACRAARTAHIPVGVCGESASDPLFAVVLVGLGVRSLSMAPCCLADVDALLSRVTVAECRGIARAAVESPNAATARGRVRDLLPQLKELGL